MVKNNKALRKKKPAKIKEVTNMIASFPGPVPCYRLGGGIEIFRNYNSIGVERYDVEKNGHHMGSYRTLEEAQASVSY